VFVVRAHVGYALSVVSPWFHRCRRSACHRVNMVNADAASVPARLRTVSSREIYDYPHRPVAGVGIAPGAVRNSTHRPPVTGLEALRPVALKFWRSAPVNAHMALNQRKNFRPVSGGANPDTGCARCRHVCCSRALQVTDEVTGCVSVGDAHSMPGSGPEIACNSVADIATCVDATAAADARRARHRQRSRAKRFQKALDSPGK